jgi:hypothetical protein
VILAPLAALLVAWLVGWLVVAAAWPASGRAWPAATLVRFSVALGLGVGLSSAAFVVAIDIGRPSRTATIVADLLLLLVVAGTWWLSVRCGRSLPAVVRMAETGGPLDRMLGLGVLLLGALFVAIAGLKAIAYPHGESDAWIIWNLKARVMARGGEGWREALAQLVASHPDYPLLLPGAVARPWTYVSKETWLAPVVAAGAFTTITVTLASAVLWLRRTRRLGLIAAVLLLGSPHLADYGLIQNADVPVAFFILAALGLLALADQLEPRSRTGLLVLAGLALGLATWTKNEGILYLVCATAAHAFVTARWHSVRAAAGEVGGLIAGASPLLAILAYHRATMPLGWVLQQQGIDVITRRALDPERYAMIGRALLRGSLDLGGWVVSVVALLILCALAWGVRVEPSDRISASRTALTLALALLGILSVYVVTPLPLEWQLGTSLPRLLTQLWPTVVLLFGLVVQSPSLSGSYGGPPRGPAVPPGLPVARG